MLVKPRIKELLGTSDHIQFPLSVGELVCNKYKFCIKLKSLLYLKKKETRRINKKIAFFLFKVNFLFETGLNQYVSKEEETTLIKGTRLGKLKADLSY